MGPSVIPRSFTQDDIRFGFLRLRIVSVGVSSKHQDQILESWSGGGGGFMSFTISPVCPCSSDLPHRVWRDGPGVGSRSLLALLLAPPAGHVRAGPGGAGRAGDQHGGELRLCGSSLLQGSLGSVLSPPHQHRGLPLSGFLLNINNLLTRDLLQQN